MHLDASCEKDQIIAQANAPVDENGRFIEENMTVRSTGGDVLMASRDEVTLQDIFAEPDGVHFRRAHSLP